MVYSGSVGGHGICLQVISSFAVGTEYLRKPNQIRRAGQYTQPQASS